MAPLLAAAFNAWQRVGRLPTSAALSIIQPTLKPSGDPTSCNSPQARHRPDHQSLAPPALQLSATIPQSLRLPSPGCKALEVKPCKKADTFFWWLATGGREGGHVY